MTILPLVMCAAAWQAERVAQPDAPPTVRPEEKTAAVRRASLVAWICLIIVYVVWGSTYLAIKVGVETMPPLLMAAVRNLVAGMIMFPLAMRSRRAAVRAGLVTRYWPSRAEWLGCATVGVLLLVANGAVGIGEQTIPSGLAALLVATVPLWLLGIDAVLNHARLGLAPVAGLALGLVGVGLLSGLGRSGRVSVVGVVVILAAAFTWALGTLMTRRVTIPSSPALASGMELLCGGVALLVLTAATGEFGSLHLAQVSWRSWLALGYLVVAGSIIAFSAYGIAVRALPTATVATYAYVNPVIAVLLGTLILNERLTPAALGGGALIVGAVVLVVRRRTRPAEPGAEVELCRVDRRYAAGEQWSGALRMVRPRVGAHLRRVRLHLAGAAHDRPPRDPRHVRDDRARCDCGSHARHQ
jgi:drug/metabolite transporter (DMT)-like permease